MKPQHCPKCHQEYAFRLPSRCDQNVTLGRYYRCQTRAYVYLHRIEYGDGEQQPA